MKKIHLAPLLKVLFMLFFQVVCLTCLAQEGQLPDDGDPVNAPLDGGVSLLIAAGLAYGAKRAYQKK